MIIKSAFFFVFVFVCLFVFLSKSSKFRVVWTTRFVQISLAYGTNNCLMSEYLFKGHHLSVFQKLRHFNTCNQVDPRPTKPFLVVTTPFMNLKLTGVKYNCLVPWYRVGSLLSIDTKIMKIGQRMTSQWRFQTWPDSKSVLSVKIDQNWKKINFFR